MLPDPYTCKGASISPKVSWEKIPEGTKSLVLIVDDPDAPKGTFTHWILYNIPPSTRQIDRDQPYAKMLKNGAQQGDNSAGAGVITPPARRLERLTTTSFPSTRLIVSFPCSLQTGRVLIRQ